MRQVFLLLIAFFVAVPSVFAQGDETYSENGFTFGYPSGWYILPGDTVGMELSVFVSRTETMPEVFSLGEGDALISIDVAPVGEGNLLESPEQLPLLAGYLFGLRSGIEIMIFPNTGAEVRQPGTPTFGAYSTDTLAGYYISRSGYLSVMTSIFVTDGDWFVTIVLEHPFDKDYSAELALIADSFMIDRINSDV